MHTKISGKGGNCQLLETTTILSVPSTNSKECSSLIDTSLYKKYNLDIAQTISEHDYIFPEFVGLTSNAENVVTYISGFVIKMLKRRVKCPECYYSTLLISEEDSSYNLLNKKNRGKYILILKVCNDKTMYLYF